MKEQLDRSDETIPASLDRPSRSSPHDAAILAIRIFIGVFFIFEGWDKHGWLFDPAPLGRALANWEKAAVPISRWYLQHLAIPGVPVFGPLVFLGEVGAGIAFLLGIWIRPIAILAFLMVLNFHFAHSRIFEYAFLSQGDGFPVLGALLALALAGDQPRAWRFPFRSK